MAKTIRLLSALLVLQVLVAAGLIFNGTALAAAENNKPLLTFKADEVDHLVIDGADKSHVVLAKVDGHWQLPDVSSFPANAARVQRLLDQIAQLKPGEPVATTAGARERFKVGEKVFERRIVLSAGNKTLGTLYLGTSPAMHQVHARVNAQDPVYSVKLEVYDIPVKTAEWEDHSVLQIPQHDIAGIDVDGLQLHRATAQPGAGNSKADTATWQATQLAAGEHVDVAAIDKLAAQLANLRVDSVLGKTAKAEYGLAKPALQLTVVRKDGKSVEYALGKMSAGADYVLKSSARDEYFGLPNYAAQQLLGAAKRQVLTPVDSSASATSTSVKAGAKKEARKQAPAHNTH